MRRGVASRLPAGTEPSWGVGDDAAEMPSPLPLALAAAATAADPSLFLSMTAEPEWWLGRVQDYLILPYMR